MKTLEQGPDKIQKICEVLKQESVEPAKREAENILAEAKARASEIVKNAEMEAKKLHEETRRAIEQERSVFQSTLKQASKLSVETLKQDIENKIFNHELYDLLQKNTKDPAVITKLIQTIIGAIEKDGLSTDLTALVPKSVTPKEINALLGDQFLQKLKEKSVAIGDFAGGAAVKLNDKKVTFVITDEALMELFAGYAPAFRKLILDMLT